LVLEGKLTAVGPVGRFSLALAVILGLTATAVALSTALFIGRYIEDETARFTERAVASHFGPVFSQDIFFRPLSPEEYEELEGMVLFHFSIYNVVRTRFVSTDGRVVFSYEDDEVGSNVSGDPGYAAAMAGGPLSQRGSIVADARRGDPTEMRGDGSYGHHAYVTLTGTAVERTIPTLEAWVPIRDDKGIIHGAVGVWRDVGPIDAEIGRIQLATSAIIAAAAAALWLIL